MLKLIQNVTPTGTIDWTNKTFSVNEIIWAISIIVVDWNEIENYSFNNNSFKLEEAPTSSVSISYFYREVNAIKWNGEVTMGAMKDAFYRKIGRVNNDGSIPQNISRLYPSSYVVDELRRSYKRITNKSPERNKIGQYTIKWTNGYIVLGDSPSENVISFEQSLENDIQGMFLVGKGIAYDYYGLNWNTFQVKDSSVAEVGDKVIVWHRIPYGVDKIGTVKIDECLLDYTDERNFNMNTVWKYTIIKDWQGNSYLFLPYSDKTSTIVVKYTPDASHMYTDDDIVDITEEYMGVIIADTAYRLLRDKEDERWVAIMQELWNWQKEWLLYEYQSYIKSQIKKPRATIC